MSAAVLSSSPIDLSVPIIGLPSSNNSLSKRPRLTLNTSHLPSTFGKKATSLRLETLSVTSPTSRNTFRNTYEPAATLVIPTSTHEIQQPPQRSTVSVPSHSPTEHTPAAEAPTSGSASPSHSVSSASSSGETITTVPYRLSFGHNSILKNGPFPHQRRRTSLAPVRQMFPAQKRVSFRPRLTEEIRTSTYVLADSEIDATPISALDLPSPHFTFSRTRWVHEAGRKEPDKSLTLQARPGSRGGPSIPLAGSKRDSSSDEDDEDDGGDGENYPKTPVAGRRKRQRDWIWTLGTERSGTPSSETHSLQDVAGGEAQK